MSRERNTSLLWWVVPTVLAGMPMPYIHPERRLCGGGPLTGFPDELPVLHDAGIRAVVSLLNIPGDTSVYESAGFSFLCLPIPDGGAPTLPDAGEFLRFAHEQRSLSRPVAVHCQAGIGRTGTLIATYLISEGHSAREAIERVRSVEPAAIETPLQMAFLHRYAATLGR